MPWHAEPWQRRDIAYHQSILRLHEGPEDKNRWIVDELAAAIVRRIFQMCVSDLGPTQIAKKLKAEQVPALGEYRRSIGKKRGYGTERPYNWYSHTVAEILDRQEYVEFCSFRQSFIQKKRLRSPRRNGKCYSTVTLLSLTGSLCRRSKPPPAPPQARENGHCEYVFRASLLCRLCQ